ncbi:MAG: HD domain-containing protein [Candidatus Promineifilaceae bacterium]
MSELTNQQSFYSPLVDRAIGFAAQKHEGQHRKIGSVPYIAHPIGVAMLLMRMGCRDEVIAAAVLHDTVEDTGASLQDIRKQFGQEVADIVDGCTELPRKFNNWEERKQNMIEKLRHASLEVKLVVAADKFHNLQHITKSKKKEGSAVWEKFSRGPELQAWYYRAMLDSILANLPDTADQYPIFDQLPALINDLFDGIPTRAPQS